MTETYLHKLDNNPYTNIAWNVPEQKQGKLAVIGGNSQSFRTPVRVAEWVSKNYPVREVQVVLPDALASKLPELPSVTYLHSTESGSFAESDELMRVMNEADVTLVVGDVSKNAITGKALAEACVAAEKYVVVTRDAVDALSENMPERWLMNPNITLMGSVAQLQKLLRAVYYPKILMMSQSLVQVAEVLHKFTLSYPVDVVTFHNGQIIVAHGGEINVVPLEKSGASVLMLWGGELAAKIACLSLYSPGSEFEAATSAFFR